MAGYIARRTLWLVPVLLFISLVTFALMHTVQGGPWDGGPQAAGPVVENLNRKYGLDEPRLAPVRGLRWATRCRATSASLTRARTSP